MRPNVTLSVGSGWAALSCRTQCLSLQGAEDSVLSRGLTSTQRVYNVYPSGELESGSTCPSRPSPAFLSLQMWSLKNRDNRHTVADSWLKDIKPIPIKIPGGPLLEQVKSGMEHEAKELLEKSERVDSEEIISTKSPAAHRAWVAPREQSL